MTINNALATLRKAYSIIPPSGEFGSDWPVHFNLPAGASGQLSTANWTTDNISVGNFGNEGFIQQTFLGASIRDFDISAGFGDSPTNLTVNLVNDEFNLSDRTGAGYGDDPYHSGAWLQDNAPAITDFFNKGGDLFAPPVVGSPVFFKFGKNPATIEQAFRKTYDDLYGIKTLPSPTPQYVVSGVKYYNAWGVSFPTAEWDQDNFDSLEPYYLVDREAGLIQDRTQLWNINTYWRGAAHFNFGGILQSYTQNKGPGGLPVYSVQVTDPREILSNVSVLFNNYQDSTFNYKNFINLYGFLEYDPSVEFLNTLQDLKEKAGVVGKLVDPSGNVDYYGLEAQWDKTTGWEFLATTVLGGSSEDEVEIRIPALVNVDEKDWESQDENIPSVKIPGQDAINIRDQYFVNEETKYQGKDFPQFFPITGQGFSRRSEKGMPWYRISQGLAAMFEYYGYLPQEYKDAGFGGQINFRGYNYVVDFGGIPTEKIPLLYYFDFDEIDLLGLAQELCDIISHDLYVSLLPVIDHPASEFLFKYNQEQVQEGKPQNIVAGIIRLDAIDKTKQPEYGAIKSYIDNLNSRGVSVENQDVGFELSNVVTDKFVAGAQETEMYFFSTERDRDELWVSERENNPANMEFLRQNQWDLRVQEQQQVLPYYGLLGDKAVSIPRGFGAFQQILLDATNLNAYGVGNYYVATELELRAALISYERWKNFILSYNDVYIEDISEHRAFLNALSSDVNQVKSVMNSFRELSGFNDLEDGPAKDQVDEILKLLENREYAVTVPRCVWDSDKPAVNDRGYPLSPCSPPFGYPLYYKRATAIGMPEAGVTKIVNAKNRLAKDFQDFQESFSQGDIPFMQRTDSPNDLSASIYATELEIAKLVAENKDDPTFKDKNERYKSLVESLSFQTQVLNNFGSMKKAIEANGKTIATIENLDNGPLGKMLFNIERTTKKHEENAKKVYEFVKKIADECLGKKFLVRLPKSCNIGYSKNIKTFDPASNTNFKHGPFGFPPRPINSDPQAVSGEYYDIQNLSGNDANLITTLTQQDLLLNDDPDNLWPHYLQDYQIDTDFTNRRAIGTVFDEGAMKGNYNPFSERWEWNYKPEPQGGYFSYNLYDVNISALELLEKNIPFGSLPVAVRNGLVPVDTKNIISDSNRVQCYVRYDHSENLDFTAVSPNDMTQQLITQGGQFIPDVVADLPNNNLDAKYRFDIQVEADKDKQKRFKQEPSMAFVKCSLDEKIYLPPRLKAADLEVFGRNYEFTMTIPNAKTAQRIDPSSCKLVEDTIYPDINPVFSIPLDGGVDDTHESWVGFERKYNRKLDAWIVNTDIEQLDDDHTYALITVPGRIKSFVDSRWRDGHQQSNQGLQLKHLMTQDTVQIPAFSKPNIPVPQKVTLPCGPPPIFDNAQEALDSGKLYGLSDYTALDRKAYPLGIFGLQWVVEGKRFIPGKPEDWLHLSLEDISQARGVSKTILKGAIDDDPNINVGYSQPSPVFPDLVVLPLMSEERCYGPWVSAFRKKGVLSSGIFEGKTTVEYSDLGGKVEFVKDENLAPWNYAGYQLLDQAGRLQADFSSSLLLFSERGGFVIPDAPTGIALATALQAEGPLITSIGINVSSGGVKTTVKLDLYTSKWGKLAKQKEMAISQVARERKKLRDEKNSAVRRGLGKRQTSTDLVNSVMQNGGNQFLSIISDMINQTETNRELGKKISEGVMVVGQNGGVMYNNPDDLARVMGSLDGNQTNAQIDNTVIQTPGQMYQAYSDVPHPVLPSFDFDPAAAMQWMSDTFNHQSE